jgi:hypothetical protein
MTGGVVTDQQILLRSPRRNSDKKLLERPDIRSDETDFFTSPDSFLLKMVGSIYMVISIIVPPPPARFQSRTEPYQYER